MSKGLTVRNLHLAKETEQTHELGAHAERDEFYLVITIPANSRRDSALDHALEETFPASDPVSITISEAVRVKSVS
jgi:hypothetical protein